MIRLIKISTDWQSTVYKVVVANIWYIAKFKNKQKLQLFENEPPNIYLHIEASWIEFYCF